MNMLFPCRQRKYSRIRIGSVCSRNLLSSQIENLIQVSMFLEIILQKRIVITFNGDVCRMQKPESTSPTQLMHFHYFYDEAHSPLHIVIYNQYVHHQKFRTDIALIFYIDN